jgi:hypothetical protein
MHPKLPATHGAGCNFVATPPKMDERKNKCTQVYILGGEGRWATGLGLGRQGCSSWAQGRVAVLCTGSVPSPISCLGPDH